MAKILRAQERKRKFPLLKLNIRTALEAQKLKESDVLAEYEHFEENTKDLSQANGLIFTEAYKLFTEPNPGLPAIRYIRSLLSGSRSMRTTLLMR